MPDIDAALRRFNAANKASNILSGNELEAALDREAQAISEITSFNSVTLCHTIEKVSVLEKIIQSAWTDARDARLLQSIKNDLIAFASSIRRNIAISFITSGTGMVAASAAAFIALLISHIA